MKPVPSYPWDKDVFASALENMQSTWKAFALTLCTLHLLLIIDVLSGSQFMKEGGAIEIGDFKIVRETLSATYGLLFTFFVVKALLESRVVRELCIAEAEGSISEVDTKAVLWLVSPFSWSRGLRVVFWLLLADGFILLAAFSAIHLFDVRSFPFLPEITEPVKGSSGAQLPIKMLKPAYVGIGVLDLLLLVFCLWRCRELVENLRFIRAKFTPARSTSHD